jgi:hypothetical protein
MIHHTKFLQRLFCLTLLVCACAAKADTSVVTGSAEALRARHAALQNQLMHNQFQAPIYLESSETSSEVKGDIYAVLDYPFATVQASMKEAAQWCDILILHLNIKSCRAAKENAQTELTVYLGKKYDQAVEEASQIDFTYRNAIRTADYMQILLHAEAGPYGTYNHRIVVEAAALDDTHTFIHFRYSHNYGFLARMALQAYLNTLARNKVGFTIVEKKAAGQPVHIGSVRGLIERNTMRYYLAIDAYLSGLALPPEQRLEKRLSHWFAATEHYSRQLHELDENTYLEMKRKEYRRQQAMQ